MYTYAQCEYANHDLALNLVDIDFIMHLQVHYLNNK